MMVMVVVIVRACSSVSAVRFFFRFPEGLKLFIERGDGFLVFKLKVSHFPSERFHSSGRRSRSRPWRVENPNEPKRRIFLRPQPKDAVMGGNGLDAFPETIPRGIARAKSCTFAVEPGVLADDLNANLRRRFVRRRLQSPEIRQPLFQSVRRQPHGFQSDFQALKIVRGGAANTKIGRTHHRLYTNSPHLLQLEQVKKRRLVWIHGVGKPEIATAVKGIGGQTCPVHKRRGEAGVR